MNAKLFRERQLLFVNAKLVRERQTFASLNISKIRFSLLDSFTKTVMWASEFQASQFLQVWNFEVVLARAQPVPSRSARAQTQISLQHR